MTKKNINIILIAVSTVALVSMVWWLSADPTKDMTVSLEGADNRDAGNAFVQNVTIGENFEEF